MKKWLSIIGVIILTIVSVIFGVKISGKKAKHEPKTEGLEKIKNSMRETREEKAKLLKKYGKKVIVLLLCFIPLAMQAEYIKNIDGVAYDFVTFQN